MRKQYTADKRAQLVELVTSRGMTIAAAAAQLGVHSSTASYWVRGAKASHRRAAPAAPSTEPSQTFVQLVKASAAPSALEIRLGRIAIRVQPGFDASLLRAVVEALDEGAA